MTTIIVQAAARALTPFVVVLSLYLLVRGHTAPGGGFAAATVASLAVVLRAYAFGRESAARLVRLGAGDLIGVGMLLALGTGTAGWLWGDAFLAAASVTVRLPLVGEVVLSTTLLFEAGVYLAVLAVVVAVVEELGRGEEPTRPEPSE